MLETKSSKSKITHDSFIEESITAHGLLYDYSNIQYVDMNTKVEILCRLHGPFWQTPSCHFKRKQGCPKCGRNKITKLQQDKKTESSLGLLARFHNVHGNSYNYDKVEYDGMHVEIIINCEKHGVFLQKPCNHVRGQGCPTCAIEFRNENLKITHNQFVCKAREVHDHKYEYFYQTGYKSGKTAVKIKCPKHGFFVQCRNSHLLGKGCVECSREIMSKQSLGSFDDYLEKANVLYNDKYDYYTSSWNGMKNDIVVICPEHGEFEVRADSHLKGSKCKHCKLNLFESSVLDYIKSLTVEDIKLYDRKALNGLELDMLINDIAIECNGIYWHSFDRKETVLERRKHSHKHDVCRRAGIKLIQINEIEWIKKKKIVQSILMNVFTRVKSLYARKCEVCVLTVDEATNFINDNHIQGYRSALVHYGLKHNNAIMAALSVSRHNKYSYEMIRYCNALDMRVLGGLSKLMNKFTKDFNPDMMVSYADRRYFDGSSYKTLGFELDGATEPNYSYIKRNVVFSRQKCQKHKLKRVLPVFDDMLTEHENMFLNGYRRLWDAGNWRYIKKWL